MKLLEVIIICSLVVLGALFVEIPVADKKVIAPSATPRPLVVGDDAWPTLSPKATIIPAATAKTGTSLSLKQNKQIWTNLDADSIFNLVNQYRISKNVSVLSKSSELCRLAGQRADFLISNDMKAAMDSKLNAHVGLKEQINSDTYSGNFIDEDIAGNAESNDEILNLWHQSAPHEASIIRVNYNGKQATSGCVAISSYENGNIVVLLIGDK